jgi:NDP-sugar pyrophosphorylase family protein
VLRYDQAGKLIAFEEKPTYDFDVSMGIYCINKAVIEKLPKGKAYRFDHLMLDGLATNRPARIRPFSGYWLDIGRPDDYQHADENFEELSAKLGI